MSIFYKDCPRCAATNSVDAIHCRCGYFFQPDKVDGVDPDLELAAQDEELYEAYLAARAEQAAKEVQIAIATLANDPGNAIKAEYADKTVTAAEETNAEYTEQKKRTVAAVKVAKSARTKPIIPIPSTPVALIPKSKPVVIRADKVSNKELTTPANIPYPMMIASTNEGATTNTRISDKPGPAFKKQQAIRAARALEIQQNNKHKKTIKSAATIKAELEAQSVKTAAALMAAKAVRNKRTDPDILAAASAKNTQPIQITRSNVNIESKKNGALKKLHHVSVVKESNKASVQQVKVRNNGYLSESIRQECPVCTSTYPPEVARCSCGYVFAEGIPQLPSLDEIVKKKNAPERNNSGMKECPHCTGLHPSNANRCGCGYVFPVDVTELPSLSLNSTDFNALSNTELPRKTPR